VAAMPSAIYSLCIGRTTETKLMAQIGQVSIVLRETRRNIY